MQTRIAFNSGEFTPELECRSDLEQYGRGCSVLENWQVSQMGGIKRRKGMRYVAPALSEESRLIPYIYSYANEEGVRFLVEISNQVVRVLALDGSEVARFESTDKTYFDFTADKVRYFQQNKLLLITSIDNPPMALEYDGVNWSFKEWELKHRPWRFVNELRDFPIEIKKESESIENGKLVSFFDVRFDENVPEDEKPSSLEGVDYLRASFWTEQKEELSLMNKILGKHVVTENGANVTRFRVSIALDVPAMANAGDMFAVPSDEIVKYWVCVADWNTSNYVEGLESPANYPNAFIAAEDIEGFDDSKAVYSIKDVTAGSQITKGTKIAIKSGYWEYYTCIRSYTEELGESTLFKNYPGFFVRGLPVGDAVPSRGAWSFYCSGVWYGSYEVRRNYDTPDLNGDWEDRGISFSRNDSASNTTISGTEKDEECFLRLFITRSRRMSDSNFVAGFPQDGCANRLIVDGYKHDMMLKATPITDGEETVDVSWSCEDTVQLNWSGYREVKDWSWAAFSLRCGYPLLCCVFQQRLVFAATEAQPLTVWFSRVDDINNFLVGDVDDAAMVLTLSAPSQNPICWIQAQDERLMLGTSTTEYGIASAARNLAFSSTSARARAHSHVGSDEIPAVAAITKAVFVGRGSSRVHEYGWNEETAGYIPRELSIFAPHIGEEHGGFIYPTLMTKPDVVLVWTMGDGQLALCTYNTLQEVRAWHRWITDGHILSACAMPDGKHEDRLYLVVKREDKTESGIVLGESVNIEVVDKDSDYVDCESRDYTSVMITNPLFSAFEERVGKRNNNSFMLRFGSSFAYEPGCFEVSVNGEVWRYPDWMPNTTISGWQECLGDATWHFEKKAGVRVNGNKGCHLLGLQG